MAFFDDVKKIGKNISDKGKDVIEITKLNAQIGSEKDKIQDLYVKIGQEVYTAYKAGEETPFAALTAEISAIESNIDELNAKILEIKDAVKCPSCGAEAAKETAYCSKCGTKISE